MSEVEKAAMSFLQADVECVSQESGTRYCDGGLDTRTIFRDEEGNECEVFWSHVGQEAQAASLT